MSDEKQRENEKMREKFFFYLWSMDIHGYEKLTQIISEAKEQNPNTRSYQVALHLEKLLDQYTVAREKATKQIV
jgi:hypothetical protein